jgi:maleylpyruvate isomerase
MLNPQGMLPALDVGEGAVLTQSLAIIEWLEETTPVPPLLPADPLLRARVRAFALIIAADIHPLQNLRVLNRLRAAGLGEPAVASWAAGIIADGLSACETLLAGGDTRFCFSDAPGLADICLIPQLYNARRFGVDLAPMPRLLAVEAACAPLPAFADSHPSHQPDAE